MTKSHRPFFRKKKSADRPRSHPSGGGGARPHHGPKAGGAQAGPGGATVDGSLQMKPKFGFVLSEDPKIGDVMIQGPSLRLAMDGDRVRARVTSAPGADRRSGEIIEVLKRAHETAVGTFKRAGALAFATTENGGPDIRILDLKGKTPQAGEIVVVKITRWPSKNEAAAGDLLDVLGSRDTPGVDLEAVIRSHELPKDFPSEVMKEAEALGVEVPEAAWRQPTRELYFDRRTFTIDGADAKDFDDAVSLEPLVDGWRLGVHIADVAEYVREGSPLDAEARRRGTSVYFTGTVVPMLPFPISDGLCSLRPDTIRLTLSCVMDIDRDGQVKNYRVVESAIKSAKRFTYEEVEEILKGNAPANLDPNVVSDVKEMGVLARLLRKKRFARGSLDFDFPEPYVVTGLNGRPIDIRKRERLEAHKLIEDFMVLANETVARYMSKQPFLYRIHETPDPARLEKLKKALEVLGLRIPPHIDATRPMALRGVLTASEGKPIQPMIHLLVLRSLKQAVYAPTNRGHFGLASECYTHFTSPIRRYPDLIVHRIVKERLHNIHRESQWEQDLPGLCEHTSKRERAAVEAEREFLDIQKTRLMEPHVGEIFNGVISSVTNFGFFVQLTEYFVEGLVHVTNLGKDFFVFDENRMVLKGQRTGRVFALGDKVKVRLAAANILKHQLDLELIIDSAPGQASGHASSASRPAAKRRPDQRRWHPRGRR